MIWSKIKLYLYSALGLLIAGLVASTKYFSAKAKKEEKRADNAEAMSDHRENVAEKRDEIDEEFRSRRAEAAQEAKDGNTPGVFRNPNKLFGNKDDSGGE